MTPETAYVLLAVILGLFFATATAKAASDKGADPKLWFIVGLLLPGAGLVIALFLDEQLTKECPRCVLRVDPNALVCGYCGHAFIPRASNLETRHNIGPGPDADLHRRPNEESEKPGRRVA